MRIIPYRWRPGGIKWGSVGWLVLLLTACAGLGRTPPGGAVRVVTAEELTDCRNVGSVHVRVVDKLPQLQQVEGGVATELLTLAEQSAEQLGGNALVEMTNIVDGGQSFEAFSCP